MKCLNTYQTAYSITLLDELNKNDFEIAVRLIVLNSVCRNIEPLIKITFIFVLDCVCRSAGTLITYAVSYVATVSF